MNTTTFMTTFRKAVQDLLVSLDSARNIIDQYGDLGDAETLDIHFANNSYDATDPLTKAKVVAAGAVILEMVAALGSGPGSNRAKLNELR
jgi:hypothetical protein